MSFEQHTAALGARTLFPEGTPEHEPAHWLKRLLQHHWTRTQMVERMRRTVTVDADEAARHRTVNQRLVEAV